MLRKIIFILLIILVVIQFIRPGKNISATKAANDITAYFPVPDKTLTILKRSCYDCHGNNTIYPWYFNIQPVGWWMQQHVNDGKHELNFSEFGSYTAKKQVHTLGGIIGQVKKDQMPLDSYLWIHKDAKLNDAEKNILVSWADSLRQTIATKNNLSIEQEGHDKE